MHSIRRFTIINYPSQCPPEHRRTVSVLLLNGRSIRIICNSATTTSHQIFEAIIQTESYGENFFLGLCALIGGDFVFLPPDLKIYKVILKNVCD